MNTAVPQAPGPAQGPGDFRHSAGTGDYGDPERNNRNAVPVNFRNPNAFQNAPLPETSA
ncbi:MAG: hypothetical protein ABL934_05465 [Lysobacteraceae bacterium]